jgi:hypothetical protein
MSTGRTEVITLTQAKQHLRMPLDVHQDDDSLYVLLEIAHGLVFDKCKSYCSDDEDVSAAQYAVVDAWTSDTAPAGVRAAILETLSDLDRNRGDASNRDTAPRYHSLSPRAEGFLALVRDPVLR